RARERASLADAERRQHEAVEHSLYVVAAPRDDDHELLPRVHRNGLAAEAECREARRPSGEHPPAEAIADPGAEARVPARRRTDVRGGHELSALPPPSVEVEVADPQQLTRAEPQAAVAEVVSLPVSRPCGRRDAERPE